MFDHVIMVDWSGGRDRGAKPKKDAIWICEGSAGGVQPPEYCRNRGVAEAWLTARLAELITKGTRVLLGFDFPMGYPVGAGRAICGSDNPLDLWGYFGRTLSPDPMVNDTPRLAAHLNEMAFGGGDGPFWFNVERADNPHLPRKKPIWRFDFPEKRAAEAGAKGAFTVWQMGGAGAVGAQAMTGMATLSRLRARFGHALRAWPFEAGDGPVTLVEIWPSLLADEIAARQAEGEIKDAAQVRVMVEMALGLCANGQMAQVLTQVPHEARASEGWIFGLGSEAALRQALPPQRIR